MPQLLTILFLTFLATTAPVLGQPKKEQPTEGDKLIEAYLARETDKLSQKFLDGAKFLEEWQKKRPVLHQQYLYMLGLYPFPEKTPLKVTITGTLEHQGVLIDKLHFQSIPGLYVTANLYRPKGNSKKLPTILYVCGHSNRGREGSKSAYQDHPMWFASNGYNCLILDTLQLGEIPGVHHGTYGRPYNHLSAYGIKDKNKLENRWWWHARGYTPAGVEAWNGIRAIDYLVSRPDVDADRIGVTGISGGGAATFWIAAADDRVKVAVPVSGMSDLESYVKNKVINGHCDCMFLYNTFQWEWTTIAALIAPRPLLFANSDMDPIFPMDGNRRIIERLRKLYKMYGKPDLVQEYVSAGGHAYRPDLRIAIFKFINKHLKNDTTTPVKDVDFEKIPGKDLRVFPTEVDIPKDAINGKIDELFVPVAKVKLPEKGKFEEWKSGLMKELREKVFRALPEKISVAKVFKSAAAWIIYETDYGMKTEVLDLGMRDQEEKGSINFSIERVDLWSAPSGTPIDPDMLPTLRKYSKDSAITLGIWPRGLIAKHTWTKKSPPNYAERSLVLVGRTLDEGRVFDVISVIKEFGPRWKKITGNKENHRLIGNGQFGILGAYAALFEPSIKEIVIVNPPKSHKEGPYFLNVLRVLDIPEALGMLAPRKLTLIDVDDAVYNRVLEIYRRAGAEKMLTRK